MLSIPHCSGFASGNRQFVRTVWPDCRSLGSTATQRMVVYLGNLRREGAVRKGMAEEGGGEEVPLRPGGSTGSKAAAVASMVVLLVGCAFMTRYAL